jgi:hypothetical protein
MAEPGSGGEKAGFMYLKKGGKVGYVVNIDW